jgi:hypothetical protein
MGGNITLSTLTGTAVVVARGFVSVVRGIAFWMAALLPLVYVPLLFVDVAMARVPVGLEGMLGVHVATLVIGHDYRGSVIEEFERLS